MALDLATPSFRKAPGLAEEIARFLRTSITEGKLKPGEKLPTEHEMSKSFGVSRSVVREAVSQLRYEGLIRSSQGLGVFVSDTGSGTSFVIDPAALTQTGPLAQIYELRITLEVDAAGLAAKRRTRRHLTEMREALDTMMLAVKRGEDGVNPDIAFHRAIAEATGNYYFAGLMKILNESIRSSIFIARANTAREGRGVAEAIEGEHRAIYQAIADKDENAARRAARAHLSHTAKQLKLGI